MAARTVEVPVQGVPFVSLFTGAGGLDLGLERASLPGDTGERRLITALGCESDPWAVETLLAAQKTGLFHHAFEVDRDVREFHGAKLAAALCRVGIQREELFLVAGGPPCPTFSTAGKRLSLTDMRGQLMYDYLAVVQELRPRFFLLENVRGLLSAALRHRPLAERGRGAAPLAADEQLGSAMQAILNAVSDLGYQAVFGRVNAANYGSPQLRHRTLIFGSRDHEFPVEADIIDLMPKTHLEAPEGEEAFRWRTLEDALLSRPLDDPNPEFQAYSAERARWFELIPPGKNWRYLRDHHSPELAAAAMGGAWASTGGKVGFFRRLAWDRPSPTLVTSPVQKATGFCHPEELRPLTVREYARVQEFPDGYPFRGSVARKYKQIGNAVPLSLGEAAGRALLEYAHPSRM